MADCGPLRVVLASQTAALAGAGGPDTAKQVGSGNPTFPNGWRQQLGRFGKAQLLLDVTAGAGTTPTLDVYVQKAVLNKDGSTVWTDVGHFLQAVGATQQVVEVTIDRAQNTTTARAIQNKAIAAGTFNNGPWGDDWQVVWTVGGTITTGFAFTVTATFWES